MCISKDIYHANVINPREEKKEGGGEREVNICFSCTRARKKEKKGRWKARKFTFILFALIAFVLFLLLFTFDL